MKKFGLLTLASLFIVSFAFAQEEDDGSTLEQPKAPPLELPWAQEDIGAFSECVPYVHQLQSDVMYYVTIWRTIDLREKKNHPLYFPIEVRGTWRSLAQVIIDAVDYTNIEAEKGTYLPLYDDEFCNVEVPRENVKDNLVEVSTVPQYDPETYEEIGTQESIEELRSSQVMYYNLKEVWFFDKERSVMEVRIIEIEPMFERVKILNTGEEDMGSEADQPKTKKRLGYIKYDELRPFMAKQEMFNIKNNAARLSFDDVMTWKRFFSSFVYAEQNTYTDRTIQEYIKNSRDQRIESERITESIRQFEHDLWQF